MRDCNLSYLTEVYLSKSKKEAKRNC